MVGDLERVELAPDEAQTPDRVIQSVRSRRVVVDAATVGHEVVVHLERDRRRAVAHQGELHEL